ncbi:Cation efflux system protein CusF [Candidatus Magnetaquicoccaceae bacterium FCR-1]|uniref:Cation efflux system protein CusF n=1 Tax=Candidatus Magnetaquiglobus chichijimensis TaxID=3141448 RepID=A0ABQ0C9Q1_9PROT
MKRVARGWMALLFGVSLSGFGAAWAAQPAGEVSGEGRLNKVDAAKRVVNIDHGPIEALKWPAMTMDFQVLPNVDLKALKTGKPVKFTLKQQPDKSYGIHGITQTP